MINPGTNTDHMNYAYNNLFYNIYWSPNIVPPIAANAKLTHDYNAFLNCGTAMADVEAHQQEDQTTDSPFTNYAGGDYSLSVVNDAANDVHVINTGKSDLGSPYNVDILSVGRPQGAGWDMGAYEAEAGVTQYALTYSVVGSGTITGAIEGDYDSGTELTLTCSHADNLKHVWSDGCSGTTTCALTMSAAKNAICTTSNLTGQSTLGGSGAATLGGSGAATITR